MTMPLGRILRVAGAGLALASCGGTEDPPDIPLIAFAGEEISMTAREYLFTPNRITLRGVGRKGVRQEVVLRNQGELAHNIEIREGDRILGRIRSFPPGDPRSISLVLPPGDYRFVCTVADHDEKGMRGTLKVVR